MKRCINLAIVTSYTNRVLIVHNLCKHIIFYTKHKKPIEWLTDQRFQPRRVDNTITINEPHMRCSTLYQLYCLKNVKNTHEGALTLAITMRINEEHRRTDKTD